MQIANESNAFSKPLDKPNNSSEKGLFSLFNSTNYSKTEDYKQVSKNNNSQLENKNEISEPKDEAVSDESKAVKTSDSRQNLLEKARKAKEEGRLSEADYNIILGLLNGVFSPQLLNLEGEVDQSEFASFISRLQDAGILNVTNATEATKNQSSNALPFSINNNSEIVWELSDTKISIQISNAKVNVQPLESETINDGLALTPAGFSLKDKIQNASKHIKETNNDSVAVVPFQDFDEQNQIKHIVPSGNLKNLESDQKGLIKIINSAPMPEVVAAPAQNEIAIEKSKIDSTSVKEFNNLADLKLNTENFSKNTDVKNASSNQLNVLDRINQVAMVQKISRRLQLRQLRDMGIVNMQLDPPELGRLLVKLTLKDKEVKVSIITESAGANEMLKNHKQVFLQAMKENGLDITEFDVAMQNGFSAETGSKMNENRERMQENSSNKIENDIFSEEKNKRLNNDPINYATELSVHKISLIA